MIARRLELLALAALAVCGGCGDDASPRNGPGPGADQRGGTRAAGAPPPAAPPPVAPVAPADPRAEEARRSRDPAFAGPILFAEARRRSTSGDSDLVLGLLAPSLAEKAREGVRRQLAAVRADRARAEGLQRALGLSKSPADMTEDEYLRESARAVATSGMADREFGRRFVSASLDKAPKGEGEVLVLVGEIPGEGGAPASVVRSVFLWEGGRWGYDPEASRARNLGPPAAAESGR
jgi:hypothetical protein